MSWEQLRACLLAHGYSEKSAKVVVDFLGERVITPEEKSYTKSGKVRPVRTA